MVEETPQTESKTFVLRLWTEAHGRRRAPRFSLEDPVTRARRSFGSLREIRDFLGELVRREGAAGRVPRPEPGREPRRTAAVLLLLGLPLLAEAADPGSLTLGRVECRAGAACAVPLLLRSGDGAPVGTLAVRVRVEPPSAATSVTFRRAGAWADRRTTFEARPQDGASSSWLVALAGPVAATTDTVVGEVVVRLAPGLLPGSEVGLVLDPAVSGFGDRGGTRFASAERTGLSLGSGAITLREHGPRGAER